MSSPHTHAHSQIDLVCGDVEALASHMRQCALAQERMFAFKSSLQQVRSVAAGYLVTIACVAVVFGLGMFAVA
ncbi:hypothetical protein [Variovorax sp. PBL-E5]|uniref:hypothetical protein n=1 Tax=Variovorax sp. PBL-E5 TaxID=434014 RepID=UPI0013188CB0|nr:hypothetical protein [Variovorax sp. PBL-E5]VTU46156.1 hypothetical protein E5P2_00529 [Variovorax sp. PBL-E5]